MGTALSGRGRRETRNSDKTGCQWLDWLCRKKQWDMQQKHPPHLSILLCWKIFAQVHVMSEGTQPESHRHKGATPESRGLFSISALGYHTCMYSRTVHHRRDAWGLLHFRGDAHNAPGFIRYAAGELSTMKMLDKSGTIIIRSLVYPLQSTRQCWEREEGFKNCRNGWKLFTQYFYAWVKAGYEAIQSLTCIVDHNFHGQL